MQLTVESFIAPRSDRPGVLQEMYESPELYNEGVLSFQYPLLVASDEELEQFLGSLVKDVGHSVSKVAHTVSNVARAVDKIVPVSNIAKGIGGAVSAVDKVVPVSLLTATLAGPLRAGLGAVQAAAEGRNVFQGALRSLVPDIGTRFLVDTAAGVAGGKNILKAAEAGMKAGVGDIKKSLQFAAMVAPFIPGIGTGVAAAIGAANALANGEPITDALIAAARTAVPGGQIAQMAFDVGTKLVQGKKLGDALLEEARSKLPGGPAAQAAFDVALALAQGKNIQQAALKATGQLLPKSPFAENAMNFVNKVASGQNIQRAALSQVGDLIYKKIQQQAGSVHLPGFGAAKLPQIPATRRGLPGGAPAQIAFNKGLQQAALAAAKGKARGTVAQAAVSAAKALPRVQGAVPKAPIARAASSLAAARTLAARPAPTKGSPPVFAGAHDGDGIAELPGGFSAQGAFNACLASARSRCMEQSGATDRLVSGQRDAPGPMGQSAASRSHADSKSSVVNPDSVDKIVESGNLPPSGKWLKRNGQVLVYGAYA